MGSFWATLSFVTFLVSMPILGGGIWLATKEDSDCVRFLEWPLIVMGAFLMLLSLIGCCRFWLNLAVFFFFCFTLIVLTAFALVVTNKGAGHLISGRGYKEYHLRDYSNWLQKRVEKNGNWNRIKICIQNSNVCNKLGVDSGDQVEKEFYKKDLSPIQSGCCKPPTVCNFAYVNATYWTASTADNFTNMDCKRWSNEEDQLCYKCESCKAGVVANLKHDWHKIAVINIVMLIALVVVYSLAFVPFAIFLVLEAWEK